MLIVSLHRIEWSLLIFSFFYFFFFVFINYRYNSLAIGSKKTDFQIVENRNDPFFNPLLIQILALSFVFSYWNIYDCAVLNSKKKWSQELKDLRNVESKKNFQIAENRNDPFVNPLLIQIIAMPEKKWSQELKDLRNVKIKKKKKKKRKHQHRRKLEVSEGRNWDAIPMQIAPFFPRKISIRKAGEIPLHSPDNFQERTKLGFDRGHDFLARPTTSSPTTMSSP